MLATMGSVGRSRKPGRTLSRVILDASEIAMGTPTSRTLVLIDKNLIETESKTG
jgi:hypothetical protein